MALDITKKYTENPFLDNLIYYVQQIAYSCILKDESVALANETDESSAAAEKFIYSKDGSGTFTMYDYTEEMMVEAGVPSAYIKPYLTNLRDVPEKYQKVLVEIARKNIIDSYEEKNNYYRMITGLPPYGEIGIPVAPYMHMIPDNETVEAVYVHELGWAGARMFEKYGALEVIKQDYPEAKYLNFITAGIDIYKARRAVDKQILYSKSCGVVEIDDLFHDKFEISRMFVERAVDSDAMEFNSEHYNAFLCMYILFLTINDCVVELQDRLVKKDILDNRCCKYIFDMYGVPYYDSIPLKYQIILVKNINALVQYKSSPKDMLNLIAHFQSDNIKINKYFLMRNRKYDSFGNPIYNSTELVDSIENEILKRKTVTYNDIHENELNGFVIPFPFLYFLNKGNKMYIWIDDIKQDDDSYIIYDYDKLLPENFEMDDNSNGLHTIRFEFYYDQTTVESEYNPNTSNPIKIHTQIINSSTPSVYEHDLDIPYENYLKDGNDIIVSINTLILHPSMYDIDIPNKKIIIDSSVDLTNRKINILYIYSDNEETKFYQDYEIATKDNQATFNIPEPFKYYTAHGNSFFITIGTVFIDPKRYTIDSFNSTITFKDPSIIIRGRSIVFHFVYNKNSIYDLIDIHHTSETVTATTSYQVEFDLHPPIEDYDARGFKVYVELLDWYLDDTYYQVYGNKLILTNLNMGLEIGDTITFHYYYTTAKNNIKTITKYYKTTEKFQSEFIIDFPDENYFEKGNKIIVDSVGIPLKQNIDYRIEGNKLTILDVDYMPYLKQKLCVEYIYAEEIENSIKIFQSTEKVRHDDPIKVWMDVPFYPYQETGHNVIAINHTTYVSDLCKTVSNYSPYMEFINDITSLGENITFLYFCNKKYWLDKERLISIKEVTKTVDDIENGILEVPEPFNNFIINDWPWFIDNNKVWMTDESYDLVNNSLAFINDQTPQELRSFTFTFLYKDCNPWIFKDVNNGAEGSEDLEKDFDLYFLRTPLTTFTDLSTIVKKQEHIKSYDTFAIGDKFWNGPDGSVKKNQTRYHDVKTSILKKKFNYARTKYLTVDYLMDVSEASFQLAYFYSMLWDDVFKENKLNIRVSTLSNYHEFNIGHLFCYMTSLMYIFQNMEDKIFIKPSEILYARGFNFHADLGVLKQWIIDQRRRIEDYDVFGFMNPDPEFVDIDQFVEAFNTNKNIYETICDGLINANTYDIWFIWKKLYDSLMIWEFNLEYFKLSDGTQATTFTDFLAEKDPILYESIKTIAAIEDENSKRDLIIQNIQDIIYILDEWIDSNEFAYIYDQFPGASQRYLLEYLFTMINFFKSYKVYLYQMTIDMRFDSPNDPDNYIRPNDVHTMLIKLDKPDYVSPREDKPMEVKTTYIDTIAPRDIFTLKYVYEPGPIYDEITGNIVVYSGIKLIDINGTIEVADRNIFYYNARNINTMANEITGYIGIKSDNGSIYELTGSISIKENVQDTYIIGDIDIPQVIPNIDITGSITLPTKLITEMTGILNISNYEITGDLTIISTNTYLINNPSGTNMAMDLNGSVSVLVVKEIHNDITGSISIPDIYYVVPTINGTIETIGLNVSEISGNVSVKIESPDIDYIGSVDVAHNITVDTNGSIDIANKLTSEMTGSINIIGKTNDDNGTINGYITIPDKNEYFIT